MLATPVFDNPARRLQIYFDARNENWNLSRTFFGSTAPSDLNLRRFAGGVALRSVVTGRWSCRTGTEITGRSFRAVPGIPTGAARKFFPDAIPRAYPLRADRPFLRAPDH